MEIAAIPLKPFGLAKARLAMVFDAEQREALSRAVAAHTVEAVSAAVGKAWVVTGDEEVSEWAKAHGAGVISEPSSDGGLNAAATSVVEAAEGGRWMIVHADLPLVTPEEVRSAWNGVPRNGYLLAPSHDGGTSVFAGCDRPPSFAYGPGSFHSHLAGIRRHPLRVVATAGFLLDLDAPSDYEAAVRHPRGSWLSSAIGR